MDSPEKRADPISEMDNSEIDSGDQVQIYESIMADSTGSPTTELLAAVRYLKDNRLLPAGFDKRTASADIAVVGGTVNDADFLGPGYRVRYIVLLNSAPGRFKLRPSCGSSRSPTVGPPIFAPTIQRKPAASPHTTTRWHLGPQ